MTTPDRPLVAAALAAGLGHLLAEAWAEGRDSMADKVTRSGAVRAYEAQVLAKSCHNPYHTTTAEGTTR